MVLHGIALLALARGLYLTRYLYTLSICQESELKSAAGKRTDCPNIFTRVQSIKNTIRDGGSTALYAVYTVYTVDMVYTFDMVYNVDMVYTVDSVETVNTVNTIQTALHCLDSGMYA